MHLNEEEAMNLLEHIEVHTEITCVECGREEKFPQQGEYETQDELENNGWRADEGGAYCPDCAKMKDPK